MFATIFGVLGPLLGPALERLFPDPLARQSFMMELFTKLQASDLAQIEVNKSEAGTGSLFVGGWRPMIGWACASALAFNYVALPFLIFILATLSGLGAMSDNTLTVVLNAKSGLKIDEMVWELMFGMLGMAGLRSFEKVKGIAR